MSYLYTVVSVPIVWLIVAAVGAIILLALWISTLLSRRWFVTIKRSEETDLIAFHLRRIADAAERLSAARESQNQPALNATTTRPVGMSSFGR